MHAHHELEPQLLLRTERAHDLDHLREWVNLLFRLLHLIKAVIYVRLERIRIRLRLPELERGHRVRVMRRIDNTAVVDSLNNLYARVLRIDIALECASPTGT